MQVLNMIDREQVIEEAVRLKKDGRTEDAKKLLVEYDKRSKQPSFTEEDPETVYDLLPVAGEIGAAIPASIAGAKSGAAAGAFAGPIGAAVGGFVGGVGAGALAAGMGRFAGESAEDYFEGRVIDAKKALEKATEAATQEAIWSSIFGLGFPVASKVMVISSSAVGMAGEVVTCAKVKVEMLRKKRSIAFFILIKCKKKLHKKC